MKAKSEIHKHDAVMRNKMETTAAIIEGVWRGPGTSKHGHFTVRKRTITVPNTAIKNAANSSFRMRIVVPEKKQEECTNVYRSS